MAPPVRFTLKLLHRAGRYSWGQVALGRGSEVFWVDEDHPLTALAQRLQASCQTVEGGVALEPLVVGLATGRGAKSPLRICADAARVSLEAGKAQAVECSLEEWQACVQAFADDLAKADVRWRDKKFPSWYPNVDLWAEGIFEVRQLARRVQVSSRELCVQLAKMGRERRAADVLDRDEMAMLAARHGIHAHVRIRSLKVEPGGRPHGLRVVQTARSVEAMNAGVARGLWPLLKQVCPGEEVRRPWSLHQNWKTGEVAYSGDMRWPPQEPLRPALYGAEYPYQFERPYAAYLLPKDLQEGERVWLEDLIEDVVAVWGSQGSNERLQAGEAVWNGKDFEILFDPKWDARALVG